ncbi:MAG: T9SS type A sorting domain-containing protein [Salibacteraceae bacterium]
MIDKTKYTLILIALFSMFTVYSSHVIGKTLNSEISNTSNTIEIVDISENTTYSNFLTNNGETIDLDNQKTNKSEITKPNLNVVVVNQMGESVYESAKSTHDFNLNNLPKGAYIIQIYKGKNLINSNKLTQLNELIVK